MVDDKIIYILPRDGDRDLRFIGELIAGVDNNVPAGRGERRWTELKLYRLLDDGFVLSVVEETPWDDYARASAYVCKTYLDVVEALKGDVVGLSSLAKRLLADAGLFYVEDLGDGLTREPGDTRETLQN